MRSAIISFPSHIAQLSRWKRRAAAFAFGACFTLAMPPFMALPLLIPSFCGYWLLVRAAGTRRQAFADGWWWGFGCFTTGLYWMCIALLTDPLKFGWLIPFTLVGLNGVIALYPALTALVVRRFVRGGGMLALLSFAAIWTAQELARGMLFTGFPWNLSGYAFTASDALLQGASLIGVYGLGFVAVLAALAPALLNKRFGAVKCVSVWMALLALFAWGQGRLAQVDMRPEQARYVEGVMLRVVQGNIAQHHKWNPERQMEGLKTYGALSIQGGLAGITHVIWPETAVPYVLTDHPSLVNLLTTVAPKSGALLTGTLRSEGEGDNWRIYNSLAVVNGAGIERWYDKHHLVPFGEFVPMRAILPIDKITPGTVDFSRGPGPQALAVPGAPSASPLICYEAIFPEEAVPPNGERPGWLLNITNDAWFGTSTGPYQHLAMSRMRAVEQGLPLVRAANTGISAVTDAYGRVLHSLPLNSQGVLDSPLPKATVKATTYTRFGLIYLLFLIGLILIFTILQSTRPHN